MSAAVTIVVNGSIVASAAPARIAAGRVVAPLSPIVVRLVTRVSYDAGAATLTIERDGLRIVVPVAFVDDDVPYVELASIVERLGGSANFDRRRKTLSIVMPSAGPIATPAPYDPAQAAAGPSAVFTPAPPRPTPRTADSELPHPRRTAIPATPSQPVLPPHPTQRS